MFDANCIANIWWQPYNHVWCQLCQAMFDVSYGPPLFDILHSRTGTNAMITTIDALFSHLAAPLAHGTSNNAVF